MMPQALHLAHERHRLFALAVTALAVCLAGPAARLPVDAQLLSLGICVLLTGVPHGAVDHHRVAPLLRRRFGKVWLPAFLIAYATLTVAVVGVWSAFPTASLLGFLLLSAHHFGSGDADDPLGVAVHGSLPIAVPAIAHPEQVGRLFALLTDGDAVGWSTDLRALQPALASLLACLLLAFSISRRRGPYGELLEVSAILALCWWLPPLISFGIYFCLWHAPRHIVHVAQELRPGPWARALASFARRALPMTVATAVGACAFVVLLPREADSLQRLLQVVFVGLAALTVPHVAVTDGLRRVTGAARMAS